MANGETVASLDVTLDSIYEVDVSTNITADAYSSESTYSVGDYVIYAKFLYKCKTAISEPEEFDAEKWDKVRLANEVESLSEEVDTKADADTVYTKTEVDTALADKADSDAVYTKMETDSLLSGKANTDDVYAKSDVDTLLASKADVSTTYTKTEVDTALESKADASTTYTKTEVDTALEGKANANNVYTKSEVYTKTETDNKFATKADSDTIKTASGSVVYFNDGADNFPLRKLVAQIEPNQSDLSGHNAVVISRANKNLVNISNFTVSSEMTKSIMTVEANTYTFSATIQNGNEIAKLAICDSHGDPITTEVFVMERATTRIRLTFTVAEQTSIYLLCSYLRRTRTSPYTVKDIQFEYGSEMTEYKAYSAPTTYTVSLPETVYGGELDVLNGSGKSTKALYTFTGTESWTYSQGYQAWHVLLTGSSPKVNTVPLVSNNVVMNIINNYDGISIRVYLRENPSITEETDMNALFSSGVKMVYELESAVSFTTDKTEIRSLLNGNVFYVDTGDIEVEYRPNSETFNSIVEIHESMPPSISELSDTNIASPTNGQTIEYNATSGKWENVSPAAITVDSELSITSVNPVENRLITMALFSKANASDVYTKTQVDNALANKADTATTYTKTEVDTALQSKADANNVYSKSEVYTKSETDTALVNKADSSSVYTKDEVYNKTQVDNIINNLPEPMIFKGTLGISGTITELPVASSSNEGFTYKVITDGTYASIVAKVGDVFVSDGSTWVLIPAGDTDSDSWRNIKVNGVEKLGSVISSGAVDFADTANVKASFDPSGNKVQFTLDGVYTSSEVDTALSAKANSADVYTKTETYSKTEVYNKTETYNKAEVDSKVGKPEFTKTFSATPLATLPDSANNVPMKSLVVDILPKETGTGTKSPSNPYVISGSDEVVITHTGKNLFDKTATQSANQRINTTYGTTYAASGYNTSPYIRIANGKDYTLTTGIQSYFAVYDKDKTFLAGGAWNTGTSKTSHANAYYIRFDYSADNIDNIQLEQGTTATAYEPYSATTHTIVLGQTVYGGEVDVVSGNGTDTYVLIDLGDLQWTYTSGDHSRMTATLTGSKGAPSGQTFLGACSIYKPAPYNAIYNHTEDKIIGISDTGTVWVYDSDYTDANAFKIAVTGQKLCYEVATPTTLSTTPTAIKTTGYDNVSADCGDVSGEYYTEQADDIVDLHNALDAEKETALTGTLEAGETEITFTSDKITTTAKYFFFTNKFGVVPTDCTVSTGSMTLTFDEQSVDVGVMVEVR